MKLLLETEKRLGLLSFSFFNEHIIGCKGLSQVHYELMHRAQYGSLKQLTLIPRAHLKSTILTVGYTIWEIVRDPNIRVFIANAKAENAETFLTEIKGHFESNQKLRQLYGDFVGKKWNEGELVVSQRTKTFKEPTIKCSGVGGSLVSQHYDLVIGDDLINETNVTTKDQIEKVIAWWGLAQSLGDGPKTKWRLIGTRYHYDDLYGNIIKHKSDLYDVYVRQAIEDGKPIWPEKFDIAALEEIKREQGSYIWSCQYLNNPVDDETAIFRKTWIKYFEDDDLKILGKTNCFITLDPAVSEEQHADNSVFVVNLVDKHNNWWIVDIRSGRMSPKKLVDMIFELDEMYHPKSFGVEQGSFQKILAYIFEEKMREYNHFVPIMELKPDMRSKKSRIRALQPRFEYGTILLRKNTAETEKFVDEYLRFPKATHDDRLDALAYQLDIAHPPKVPTERSNKKKYTNNLTKY